RAVECGGDLDDFVFGFAVHACDNHLVARHQLARDRGEVLDATILEIVGRLEARHVARFEDEGTLMAGGELEDLAALGRMRPRGVHDRGAELDAAQADRGPFHGLLPYSGGAPRASRDARARCPSRAVVAADASGSLRSHGRRVASATVPA